jgi:serine/threonine protein kinase
MLVCYSITWGKVMALEGTQIGHYRLQRLIGSGGMSEVYFAEDTHIPRHVAVKVVRNEVVLYPNVQATQEATRLFEREMKAISTLDHPNILPLYDFGEETVNTSTLTYMVMPFRSEGSLIAWLHQHSTIDTLPLQEVVHIVLQAASALQHAHNHRLVHLDVKPSNFLIRYRDDRPELPDVLLTDFGIAKFNTVTATASQSIRGTPAYMAPEQWEGNPVPATDQYALAVMTYQLLTGVSPFQGNMHSVMYQHLQVYPRPPSSLNPHLPATIDAVILRALAKNHEGRFPSIQAFAQALKQASQNIAPAAATSQQEEDTPTVITHPKGKDTSTPNISSSESILAASASTATVYQNRLLRDAPRGAVHAVSELQSSRPQKTSWGRSVLIALIALILIVGSAGVTVYIVRSTGSTSNTHNNTTATVATTAQTATYPHVAGSYNGTIHNTFAAITTSMSLSINQTTGQGSISGFFTVGPELQGAGPFTGTVDPYGKIQFTVQSNQVSEPIFFTGIIQSNGSMSGTYCSVNGPNQCDPNAGKGIWNVTRST